MPKLRNGTQETLPPTQNDATKLHTMHSHYQHRRTERGGQGGHLPPPIRAVCRHKFWQRVEIILAKPRLRRISGLLLQLTEKILILSYSMEITENFRYYRMWSASGDHGKCLLPPRPPPNLVGCKQFAFAIRAKLGLTPQTDVGPYACLEQAHSPYPGLPPVIEMGWMHLDGRLVLCGTVEPLTNDHPHQRPSLSYDHISCDGQWFLFVYEFLTSDHTSYTTTPM